MKILKNHHTFEAIG